MKKDYSNNKTNYTYDFLGNVTSVSIGSISGETAHTYRYEYDLPGNLTKRIDSADKMYYYEYNDSGLLTKSTDANGVVTEYSYDVLGRKTSIQNSIDPEITYSYDVFGELVRIQQGEKYIEYTYDSLENKTTENNGLTLDEYTYDERGNITQHKSTDIAAGAVVTGYEYNALNLPVLVRTGMGIQTIEYDKAGRIIRSQNSNTGAEKTTVYDGRGLIKRTQTAIGDRIIFSEKNWYDSVGNKIFIEEDGEEHEYRYDGMNRLIYAKTSGSEIYYEFDGFGNISHEDISTPLFMHSKDYFYDADNRLTMIKDGDNFIDYGYDNAGNVTDINTGSKHTYFRYDGFGRLINADDGKDTTEYTYSPDGRRDSKITNGNKTRFVYDGRNVSAEILPDGNVYTYYRADEIIGSKDSFGNELYYTQNTHGDVIKITDMFGMTIKDYKYSPYGKEETFRFDSSTNNPWILQWKAETTKIHNPFRYAGEYFDEETGFIYLRNRYYDTKSSRFVSEDPIRDGLNWYAYCGGNPITFVDPSGLKLKINNDDIYTLIDDDGHEYQKSGKDMIIDEIKIITGDSGYYYDSENYICHIEGNEINGGSEVARKIIDYLINLPFFVNISIKDTNDLTQSGYIAGGGGSIHINSIYSSDERRATIVHELTHAYTAWTGVDNRIIMNFKTNNKELNNNLSNYIKRQHQEATAITVEEYFRKEMGYLPRKNVTDRLIGVNNYAQFPMRLTSDPNSVLPVNKYNIPNVHIKDYVIATTLYTYSEGIVDYILSQNY